MTTSTDPVGAFLSALESKNGKPAERMTAADSAPPPPAPASTARRDRAVAELEAAGFKVGGAAERGAK